MDKKFNEVLQESYDFFKSQGVDILGRGFAEVSTDPVLYESYVDSLVAGASANDAAAMSALMYNTNAQQLNEGLGDIAPMASMSGPVIRKLWPKFALKHAVKTEVAKTPAFTLNWTRPYYAVADAYGEEVRHYLPAAGMGAAGKDMDNLSGHYITKEIPLAAGVGERKFEIAGLKTHSLIKTQPLDADVTLDEVFIGRVYNDKDEVTTEGTGYKVGRKIGIGNTLVHELTVKDGIVDEVITVVITADLKRAVVKVFSIGKVAVTGVKVRAHVSTEFNEAATTWSFETVREDIRIPTGEHFNANLPIEALTDLQALYQIDGTKEVVELMTNGFALNVDQKIFRFLEESFLSQPGHNFEFQDYPAAAAHTAVFDVLPAAGFAGGPKAWREELKPVIDHLAARIKNATHLGTGHFNIIGNPLDIQLLTNVNWNFRGGQETISGVAVDYSLGTYQGVYPYKIVSTEIVPQGRLFIDFIPETNSQVTYGYWAYTFSTEKGYRDPNRANVPSIMMTKRDVLKSFLPAIGMVAIVNNDGGAGYNPFREFVPTAAYPQVDLPTSDPRS